MAQKEASSKSLAAALGLSDRVRFLGDQSNVENLLGALDLVVLSSVTESMPNAVLEAMTTSRPVVATDVGGIRELVADGLTGYLVPVRNPDALAARILQILRNPQQGREMGRAARARVEREFSGSRMKKELNAFYDSMLRRYRPAGRVLQIGNYPPPACGWSIHSQFIQQELAKRGVDSRVLDIGPGRDLPKPGCIHVRNGWDYLRKLVSYRMRGFRFQPHVNGDSWKGYLLAMAAVLVGRLTAKPAVLMFHAGNDQIFFPRKRGIWFRAFRFLFRLSGEIICNSELVREAILRYGIAPEKVHPVFSADYVAREATVPIPPDVETFFRGHQPRLVSYALFRPEFTVEALLAAFCELRRAHPGAGLVICGPIAVPEDVRQLLRRLEIESSVLIAGNLPHAEFLSTLRRADLFIRSAVKDGQCASVLEALTLGIPVVAADNGARPPAVITYAPGDAADLTRKISAVLADLETFRRQTQPPQDQRGSLETEVSLLMAT